MFDNVVEALFGSLTRGGVIEGALGTVGRAGAAELFAMGSRGFMAEGIAHLFTKFGAEAVNMYIDYLFVHHTFGEGAANPFGGATGIIKDAEVMNALTGHSFIASQLKAHATVEKIAPLAEQYSQLGMALPDAALLKSAHRGLAKLMHPDTTEVGEALIRQLNNARDFLSEGTVARQAYEASLRNPTMRAEMESVFSKLGNANWKQAFERAASKPAGLLENGASAARNAQSWFSNLSTPQKGAVVFGTVAAVGVGCYLGAKWLDKRREAKQDSALAKYEAAMKQTIETQGATR